MIRVVHLPGSGVSAPELEGNLQAIEKQTKGEVVSVCKDGGYYLVVVRTKFKGIIRWA